MLFAQLSKKGVFSVPLVYPVLKSALSQGNQILNALPIQVEQPLLPKAEEWSKQLDPIVLATLPAEEVNRQTYGSLFEYRLSKC